MTATTTARRRTPLFVTISAWAVPILVIAQFSMLAVVPVLIVLLGALLNARARTLRWWAILLAAVYATPLVIWILRPDGAPSLSKDMHPAFAVLIVAVAVVLIVKIVRRRR